MTTTYENYNRLVSFASVHQALKAENLLRLAQIDAEGIPTPREVDTSCGQSILFRDADEAAVLAIFNKGGVVWGKVFSRDGVNRVYEKIKDFAG